MNTLIDSSSAIEKTAIAYTDGSYNTENLMWGYGACLYVGDEEYELSGNGEDVYNGHQIQGEVTAVLEVCARALSMGIRRLEIRYDYEGVRHWALGTWKANKPYTQDYARRMQEYRRKMEISFTHVKAHTGVVGNEKVDKLAKAACGLIKNKAEAARTSNETKAKVKFAILAPGHIAQSMARTVREMPEVECYAVASRNLEKAKNFAAQYGFEKAYGSYEEMLDDPEVELVYVASPHSHHYEHAKMCLKHGKNVLLEKAFTVNYAQAKEIIDLAESKGLLLSEALWTRYMPSRHMIDELTTSGIIGDVVSLTANLGYEMSKKERLVEPSLAGGALLDVGVYPMNFALMVINEEIKSFQTTATMSEKGVDLYNSINLTFESGKMAMLHSNMLARTNRLGVIYGTKGFIEVQNINNCEELRVYDRDQNLIKREPVPTQITGYEYEVISCINAIQNHKTECDEMPHSETLRIMKLMDDIREEWAKNNQ